MGTWLGLAIGLVSAVAVNWAYTLEHAAAARLPPLSPLHPWRSARLLLRNRPWLFAFGLETAGWIVYVIALRLAPIALVQAVGAAGIAVLAFVAARGDAARLSTRERIAVAAALVGLVLLGLSLTGTEPEDHRPHAAAVAVWLGACAGGAVLLIVARTRFARAATLGLATGLFFACGDICAKLLGYGGTWFLFLLPLIACYATGTTVLQSAFQQGNALTAAGIATMATNAIPIAAGFVLFDSSLPEGYRGVLQIAAFASLVLSATALGRPDAPTEAAEQPDGDERAAAGYPAAGSDPVH
jgi:hypothetical protein